MTYRAFAPLGRDLSRLVLGTLVYRTTSADVRPDLLDAWLRAGGNVVDSAREYGASEAVLGRWMRERGCRDAVVVITKGGHPDERGSRLTPDDLAADLEQSLAVLGTDFVDVYLLHRDDPDVAVGPVLEALNAHVRAGRIRCFGASNWSTARLEEAREYASAHGLESFACSSPSLSLATQNEPPWPGCVSASDRDSRRWYERTRMPVFAWSSQAAGFFTGRYVPGRAETADVGRVYDSPDNSERLRRARELAAWKGCSPGHVALAWVLHQPLEVFPIIGPRTVEELHSSLAALEVSLAPDELSWLALES